MESTSTQREETSSARNKKFYTIPNDERKLSQQDILRCSTSKVSNLLEYISSSVIGRDKIFNGPFGPRKVSYLDYTASGRGLSFIEDYIREEVLPEYGNTHTTTSVTSLQTTLYRHEARDIIRSSVNASEHDAVIFVGSGCTGAVHKLIHALDFKQPPVVFVGPYEHHSIILPWKEIGATVFAIKEDDHGLIDIQTLTEHLTQWQNSGRELVGCFSAASNITGILTNVDQVTGCLHKYNALAFWDYATAAPYVKVDMNPAAKRFDEPALYKDAIFMSVHKFVGGVSTPGVLVAKKSLFRHTVPEGCGGGSVFFVRESSQRYLQEPELREEAGTPAIVQSIRAGMVFQLKEAVGHDVIMERETSLYRKATAAWQNSPNLVILGNKLAECLPIFSFLIHHGDSGLFLHHNFVTALLNDLFGIQARGGCACAGPYAQKLLGIDEKLAEKYEHLLAEDSRLDRKHLRRYREYSQREILRPGFTRINFPYFMSNEEVEFVIEAVQMVADEGWKLLPLYMFNPETGEWRHRHHQVFKDRKWLGHISYGGGQMSYRDPFTLRGQPPQDFQDCLKLARQVLDTVHTKPSSALPDHSVMFDEESKPFRWFLLPSEAQSSLSRPVSDGRGRNNILPFCPSKFKKRSGIQSLQPKECDPSEKSLQTEQIDNVPTNRSHLSVNSNNGNTGNFQFGMVHSLDYGFRAVGDDMVDSAEIPQDDVCVNISDCDSEKNGNLRRSNSKNPKDSNFEEKLCLESGEILQNSDKPSRNYGTGQSGSQQDEQGITCVDVSRSKLSKNNFKIYSEEGSRKSGDLLKESTTQEESFGNSCILNCRQSEMTKNVPPKIVNKDPLSNILSLKETPKSSEKETEMCGDVCLSNSEDSMLCKKKALQECNVVKGKPLSKLRQSKLLWKSPGKNIFNPFIVAVEEYGMFKPGDRVLIGLSGGKDSLSLLHTIRQYQFYGRSKGIDFEFGAVTVDPQTPSYDPSPLKAYLADLNVPYFFESQDILKMAEGLSYECASICSFCSRMKRGRMYTCARREGYNVIALGQHLDDLSESFLMSFFHNGVLRTMKAAYTVEEEDLRVIRPFVYVREKLLREFAEKNHLPVIAENCPACFEAPKERHRVKQLLASQEILHPHVYNSMMAAMKPIIAISETGLNVQKLLNGLINDGRGDEENV